VLALWNTLSELRVAV